MDKQEVNKFFTAFMDKGNLKNQIDKLMKVQGVDLPAGITDKMQNCADIFLVKMKDMMVDSFMIRFSDTEFKEISSFFHGVAGSKFHSFSNDELRKMTMSTTGMYAQFMQEMISIMMNEILGEAGISEFKEGLNDLSNELRDKLGIPHDDDEDEDEDEEQRD